MQGQPEEHRLAAAHVQLACTSYKRSQPTSATAAATNDLLFENEVSTANLPNNWLKCTAGRGNWHDLHAGCTKPWACIEMPGADLMCQLDYCAGAGMWFRGGSPHP